MVAHLQTRWLRQLLALAALGPAPGSALDNGLALLPYMGYNTWYDFECQHINASNVMRLADAIVGHGLDKLGYAYLNIDDCWQVRRDPSTQAIREDPAAFPQGMKALVNYVHSKGLKFGIYTDRGTATCAGRPGSLGHEEVDANTYASWGVDLVKEDSCNADSNHSVAFEQYGRMRDALNRTGRAMIFNLCGWSSWYAPQGARLGNSWRVAGDGSDWGAVVNNALVNADLAKYAGPGGWNDPDFLLGSSPLAAMRLTPVQSRMQFSLWAVMAAPLIISSNMLHISDFDLATYTNRDVIDVDQDPLGVQGVVVSGNCPRGRLMQCHGADCRRSGGLARKPQPVGFVPSCQQVWAKPLAGGDRAVVFVNFASAAANTTCDGACFERMGYSAGRRPARVLDLWSHRDLGPAASALRVSLEPAGGFAMYRLSGGGADGGVQPARPAERAATVTLVV